ncbi:hypothetical protein HYS91_00030 [Candidatus Daviesbacteria bacterium]|nr:hypothetical protein [Candidatus Daviesbacteria bacterium]
MKVTALSIWNLKKLWILFSLVSIFVIVFFFLTSKAFAQECTVDTTTLPTGDITRDQAFCIHQLRPDVLDHYVKTSGWCYNDTTWGPATVYDWLTKFAQPRDKVQVKSCMPDSPLVQACIDLGKDDVCDTDGNATFDEKIAAGQCEGHARGNVGVKGVDEEISGQVVNVSKGKVLGGGINPENKGKPAPADYKYIGATIKLTKDGKTVATVTKSNGKYGFDGLGRGAHKIELVVPSGYELVEGGRGTNPKTFDIDSCDDVDNAGWDIKPSSLSPPSPSPNPSIPPSRTLVKIELAEDPTFTTIKRTLTEFNFDSDGNVVLPTYTFSSDLGQKQLCARFYANDGTTEDKCNEIELIGPDPDITNLNCTRESGGEISFDITGANFGSSTGRLETEDVPISISGEWAQTRVNGLLSGASANRSQYTVTLTRFDGRSASESCEVGTPARISLGTDYFCPAIPEHRENGVNMSVYDNATGQKVQDDVVSIAPNGVVEGLDFELENGRDYTITIDTPTSLRRNKSFTADSTPGTTQILNIGLPAGDIAPPPDGDGTINAVDKAELNRQWSLQPTVSRSGDFNEDSAVNSFDWACMVYNFGEKDDSVPSF